MNDMDDNDIDDNDLNDDNDTLPGEANKKRFRENLFTN